MLDIMNWMISEKIAKNNFNAAAIVNGLELYKLDNDEAMKARCKLYRDCRNAGEKPKTAFVKAIAGEPVLAEGAKPMFDGAMLSEKRDVDKIMRELGF